MKRVNSKSIRNWMIVILSIIAVVAAHQCYIAWISEEDVNYGMHPYEERAIVKQINLDEKEITVFIEDSDTYQKSERNPYAKGTVMLDCSKMEGEEITLEDLKVDDKIAFFHTRDQPYGVQEIKLLQGNQSKEE